MKELEKLREEAHQAREECKEVFRNGKRETIKLKLKKSLERKAEAEEVPDEKS